MQGIGNRGWLAGVTLVVALVLAGCARTARPGAGRGSRHHDARAAAPRTACLACRRSPPMPPASRCPASRTTASPATTPCGRATPSAASARKPARTGSDIARWNNLDNPDLIEVGQVLRVIPPVGGTARTATSRRPPRSRRRHRPVTQPPSRRRRLPRRLPPRGAAAKPTPPLPPSSASPPAAAASGDEDVGWIWPAQRLA